MLPEYENIYRDLISEYRYVDRYSRYTPGRHLDPDEIYKIVKKAHERAGFGKRLRNDAILFLLANLHQLIAMPLLHKDCPYDPESVGDPVRFDRVRELLLKDTARILSLASENAHDKDYITASNVLNATSNVLDSLQAKHWRLWDSEDER